jgi:hypothetical protein
MDNVSPPPEDLSVTLTKPFLPTEGSIARSGGIPDLKLALSSPVSGANGTRDMPKPRQSAPFRKRTRGVPGYHIYLGLRSIYIGHPQVARP